MAGYSGTPLQKKLGIKPGARVVFVNEPPSLRGDLGELPEGVKILKSAAGDLDFAHAFVKSSAELERQFAKLASQLQPAGMLWISWPKKASGVATDLNENIVRDIGLANGLVDVKVCAVDETWSGLKFVIRVKDRAEAAARD
ncbi:MAG TPA: DUF3052 domain-containing protein [Terriglobales bacterium]|nr:DUF3052 domain-containing protein [Terriglobales bacterium]